MTNYSNILGASSYDLTWHNLELVKINNHNMGSKYNSNLEHIENQNISKIKIVYSTVDFYHFEVIYHLLKIKIFDKHSLIL